MNVTGGDTDVTTYFVMRLAATGVAATGLDITTMDLQYVRTGTAPVAKVDATELAATDTAHTDNKAKEIDATDQPGLYRVDWPDAAFAAGVRQVILTVKCATCFTEHLAVDIDPPVNVTKVSGTAQTANDNGADINAILLDTGTDGVVLPQAQADKVWDTAARILTASTNFNDLSAAEVNAEVVDALGTDTLAELAQGIPSATPTIKAAIMALYMALRNKVNVDTNKEITNDAGTVIFKKALTDDGTTYSEAEAVSGP